MRHKTVEKFIHSHQVSFVVESGLVLTQPDRRVGRLKSARSAGQPHTVNCFRYAEPFIVALY